jgi:hypothetical protein
MISLHDHRLLELSINAEQRTIRMLTSPVQAEGAPRTEALFTGVEVFVMEGDSLGTIISQVVEVDAAGLHAHHVENMSLAVSRDRGHAAWAASKATAATFFREHEIRGYELTSSAGMYLAIWGRGYSVQSV